MFPTRFYPVYVDDNVMAGRKILYLPATAENGFLPMPDEAPTRTSVYICSPNNPTGATYSVEQLKAWVAWAKANDAVILFDAAYECFVLEPGLARSIFEVEGREGGCHRGVQLLQDRRLHRHALRLHRHCRRRWLAAS